MADIKRAEYIKVKRCRAGYVAIFGDVLATKYRCKEILNTDLVIEIFKWMQKQNPEIEEFHIGAFATPGKRAKAGNPDGAFGPNAWCHIKLRNSSAVLPWVFLTTYDSADNCAAYCAATCAYTVRYDASFFAAVLGNTSIDKQKSQPEQNVPTPEIEKLKDVDLSKLAGKIVELNGYKIMIKKTAQDTKVKG